jgi:hypothetical protein
MQKESEVWINKDNITAKITTDLFETPASTGYHTRFSEHWRVNSTSYNYELAKILDEKDEFVLDQDNSVMGLMQEGFGQHDFVQRQEIEAFLSGMIKNGSERERLPALVDEYVRLMKTVPEEEEKRAEVLITCYVWRLSTP